VFFGRDFSTLAANVVAAWRGRRLTEARAGAKPAKLHKGFCGLHRLSRQTARYLLPIVVV